jgi:hypothetical protein
MLNRFFLPLILSLAILAGCLGHAPAPPPATQPTNRASVQNPTNELHVTESENFTAVIAYASDKPFNITQGNVTLHGPISKAFYFFHVPEKPAQGTLRYLGYVVDAQERARNSFENNWTGERRVECLDGSTSQPCPLSDFPGPNFTADPSWIYTDEVVPAGRGYFVINAEFSGTFVLNITFSKAIQLGETVLQAEPLRFATWDQFSSRYADVRHCGYVYACGVMLDGKYPMSFPGSEWVEAEFSGHFAPAGALSVCVVESGASDCVPELFPSALGVRVSMGRLLPGGTTAFWQVSAFGGGPDGLYESAFMFYGVLIGFSLPDSHPLA